MKFVIFLLILTTLDFSAQIALTFDDGPCTGCETLLDALAAANVKATFFLVGQNVAGNEAQITRAVADGHEIGCHGFGYNGNPPKSEVLQGQAAINAAGGGICKYFRVPNLDYSPIVVQACEDLGLPLIGSDVVAGDWDPLTTAQVVDKIVSSAHDGALALLHWPNTAPMTAAGVVEIVNKLKAKGYDEFLTVSELAAAKNLTLQAGKRYDSFGCVWLGGSASPPPTTCEDLNGCELVSSAGCRTTCAATTCQTCDHTQTCAQNPSCQWYTDSNPGCFSKTCASSTCSSCDNEHTCTAKPGCEYFSTVSNPGCYNSCADTTCSSCDSEYTCAGKTGCIWDQSKCSEPPPASSLRSTPLHLFVMGIAFVIGASLAGLFA